MKKNLPFLLCALLFAVAGSSFAAVHVECHQAKGKCVPPTPPTPPAPPVPPAPPAPPPPGPDGATIAMPAPPAIPPLPALPAPAPPKIPDVPVGAHAACASKAEGSSVTWTIRKGETMTGVCEREDGKMVFQLRRYDLDD
jgi:hypothetical protein